MSSTFDKFRKQYEKDREGGSASSVFDRAVNANKQKNEQNIQNDSSSLFKSMRKMVEDEQIKTRTSALDMLMNAQKQNNLETRLVNSGMKVGNYSPLPVSQQLRNRAQLQTSVDQREMDEATRGINILGKLKADEQAKSRNSYDSADTYGKASILVDKPSWDDNDKANASALLEEIKSGERNRSNMSLYQSLESRLLEENNPAVKSIRSGAYGFAKGSGIESALKAVSTLPGARAAYNDYDVAENNERYEQRKAATTTGHEFANTAGNIAGNVARLSLMPKVQGPGAVRDAALFGGSAAITSLGDALVGQTSKEDYAKDVLKSTAAGAIGGLFGDVINAGFGKFLKNGDYDMLTPFQFFLKNEASSLGSYTAYSVADYTMSKPDYAKLGYTESQIQEAEKERRNNLYKSLVTGFLFSTISNALAYKNYKPVYEDTKQRIDEARANAKANFDNFTQEKPVEEKWFKGVKDEDLKNTFTQLAKKYHPDNGGDASVFDEIAKEYRSRMNSATRTAQNAFTATQTASTPTEKAQAKENLNTSLMVLKSGVNDGIITGDAANAVNALIEMSNDTNGIGYTATKAAAFSIADRATQFPVSAAEAYKNNYDGTDIVTYDENMKKAYLETAKGNSLKKLVETDKDFKDFYGNHIDAVDSMVRAGLDTYISNSKMLAKEANYGERNYLSGEGSRRTLSLGEGERAGSISQGAGGTSETWRPEGSLAEEAARDLVYGRGKEADAIIRTAGKGQTVHLIENGVTPAMKRAESMAKKAGVAKVIPFASDAPIKVVTGEEMRACYDPKNDSISYRVNDDGATGEQQMKHELVERGIVRREISVEEGIKTLTDKIKEFGYAEEVATTVINKIASAYGKGGLKEFLCDASAGINQFAGVEGYEAIAEFVDNASNILSSYTNEKLGGVFESKTTSAKVESNNAETNSDVEYSVALPYRQGSVLEKQWMESADKEAVKTYTVFKDVYNIGKNNKVQIKNGNGNTITADISKRFMLASEWNEYVDTNPKFAKTAKMLADSLPENIRKNAHILADGHLEKERLEEGFKLERSFTQRIVDGYPSKTGNPEVVVDGKKVILDRNKDSIYFVGGEEYRRELYNETRKAYENGTLTTKSVSSMARDAFGALGFISASGKTIATGDFNTVCPQLVYDNGCWYCYRTAQLRTGMNNKLSGLTIWYTGEILRMPQSVIDALNASGGLRLQSNGDYDTFGKFNSQLLDVLRDADSRGLIIKLVTKEPYAIETLALLKEQGFGKTAYAHISTDFALVGSDPEVMINPTRPWVMVDGKRFWARAVTLYEANKMNEKWPWVLPRAVATNVDEAIFSLNSPMAKIVTLYHGDTRTTNASEKGNKTNTPVDRISQITGERLVDVEPIGNHGMPIFENVNGKWRIAKDENGNLLDGKNKWQKELTKRIQEEGLEEEYVNKTCCQTGNCSTCPAKCGYKQDAKKLGKSNGDAEKVIKKWLDEANKSDMYQFDEDNDYAPKFSSKLDLPKKDSSGRTLTDKQQEYFKDSKVRDDNGSLLIVHHSTNNDFTVFDRNILGKNTDSNAIDVGLASTSHVGYWFNSNDIRNKTYQKKELVGYLDIKNPYYAGTVQGLANNILDNFGGNFSELEDRFYDNDFTVTKELGDSFRTWLESRGYDGIILDDEEFGGTSYVALNENQFKLTSNENPTENEDIRFSSRLKLSEFAKDLGLTPDEKEILSEYNQALRENIAEIKKEREERIKLLREVRNAKKIAKNNPSLAAQKLREITDSIDTASLGMLSSTREKLSSLYSEVQKLSTENPDYAALHPIERMNKLQRLSKTQIKDMSLDDVEIMLQEISMLKHVQQTQDKLLKQKDRVTISRAGKQWLNELDEVNKLNGGIREMTFKYMLNNLNPERAMKLLSNYNDKSIPVKLVRDMQDGLTKKIRFQQESDDYFRQFLEDSKNKDFVKHASDQNIEVVGKFGKVYISPGMRVALYLHSLNTDNLNHIAYGGVTIPEPKYYAKGDYRNAYAKGRTIRLLPSEIKSITDKMTDSEKEYAKLVHDYLNGPAKEKINETSVDLTGVELAVVDDYFMIPSDKSFVSRTLDMAGDPTIEGWNNLKPREARATNPIYLEDATKALKRHIEMASTYYGLAIPVRNFNKVYDYHAVFDGEHVSVKKKLSDTWNASAIDYIENFVKDVNTGGRLNKKDSLEGLRSLYASSTLTLNVPVAIKQTTSYFMAGSILGTDSLGYGLAHRFTDADREYMDSITPWGWARRKGQSSIELGDLASKNTLGAKISRRVPNLNVKTDVLTTDHLFLATEHEIKKTHPGLKRGDKEYDDALAEMYNQVLWQTQPQYDAMFRPEYLRDAGSFARTFGMFKTESMQMSGELFTSAAKWKSDSDRTKSSSFKEAEKTAERYKRAYDNAVKRNTSKEEIETAKNDYEVKQAIVDNYKKQKSESAKKFAKTLASYLASNISFALAGTFINKLLMHKTKSLKDDKGQVTAEGLFEDIGSNLVSSIAGGTFAGSQIYDLSKYLFDIIRTGKNKTWYDIEAPGLSLLNDLAESCGTMVGAFVSEDSNAKLKAEAAAKFVLNLSKLTSVGFAQNVLNVFNAVILHAGDAISGNDANGNLFDYGKGILRDDSTTIKQYANRALYYYEKGDDAKGDAAVEDMRKAGADEEKIKTMIEGQKAWIKMGGTVDTYEDAKSKYGKKKILEMSENGVNVDQLSFDREPEIEDVPDRGYGSVDDLQEAFKTERNGNLHHIVEKEQLELSGFDSKEVNNMRNAISLPAGADSVHSAITQYYNSIQDFTGGKTVRQWLAGKTFEYQWQFGMDKIREYGDVVATENGWMFFPNDEQIDSLIPEDTPAKGIAKDLNDNNVTGDARYSYIVEHSKDYSKADIEEWFASDKDRANSKAYVAWTNTGGTTWDYIKHKSDLSKFSGDGKKERVIRYINTQTSNRERKKALWLMAGYKEETFSKNF